MTTAKDKMEAANAFLPKMGAKEAISKHGAGESIFIDLGDTVAIKESGTIKGAHRVPPSMIKFRADPEMKDLHNPIFRKDAETYLI